MTTTTPPATATHRPAPACTTPTPPATALPCPSCQADTNFAVNLYGLEDGNAFVCDCGAEFSFDFLRRLVNVWGRVLGRVAAMAEAISADVGGLGGTTGLPTEGGGASDDRQ